RRRSAHHSARGRQSGRSCHVVEIPFHGLRTPGRALDRASCSVLRPVPAYARKGSGEGMMRASSTITVAAGFFALCSVAPPLDAQPAEEEAAPRLGVLAPANLARPRPAPPFDLTGTWQHESTGPDSWR